jgi:hypothetical protein
MKKLMSSLDSVDPFTKRLEKKRNQEFFERVKKTSAYYHHQEWEEQYQHQVSRSDTSETDLSLSLLTSVASWTKVHEASKVHSTA